MRANCEINYHSKFVFHVRAKIFENVLEAHNLFTNFFPSQRGLLDCFANFHTREM